MYGYPYQIIPLKMVMEGSIPLIITDEEINVCTYFSMIDRINK